MPVLTKINTNVIADNAVTAAKTDQGADSSLSGTISGQRLQLSDEFTLTGDLTVNDDLVLGKVTDDGTGQSLTGSGKTITGTGTLTMGSSVTDRVKEFNQLAISEGAITSSKLEQNVTIAGDFIPSTPLSHRNMIINGAMQVTQRGTSFTGKGGANKSYTLDRFSTEWYNGSETAKFTITRDALGTSDLPRVNEGLSFSYKIDCTTAIANQNANANNLESLDYRIEAQDLQNLRYGTSSAQTVCLSFWFKSPKSGTHIVGVMQDDNSNKIYLREFTIASADTWQKIAVTFPGDTSGVINNDNGIGLRIIWPLYTGNNRQGAKDAWRALSLDYTTSSQQNLLDNTANNICITGVQLELGSNATPFEHRSYGDELARCQRYYHKYGEVVSQSIAGGAIFNTTTVSTFSFRFSPPMRGASQVTFLNLNITDNASFVSAVTAITGSSTTGKSSGYVRITHASGGSTWLPVHLTTSSSVNVGYIAFDAEL